MSAGDLWDSVKPMNTEDPNLLRNSYRGITGLKLNQHRWQGHELPRPGRQLAGGLPGDRPVSKRTPDRVSNVCREWLARIR